MDKRGEFPVSENFEQYIKDKKLNEHDINIIADFLINESIEREDLLLKTKEDLAMQDTGHGTKTMEEVEIVKFMCLQHQLINNYIGRLMLTLSIWQGEIPRKFKELKKEPHKN